MEGVIYYPTIRIPSGRWINYALLYWDSIAAITPEHYIGYPELHTPFNRELIERNLIRQVFPWEANLDVVRSLFVPYVEQIEQDELAVRRQSFQEGDIAKIHKDKMHDIVGVLEYLAGAGLATSTYDSDGWYSVERLTADGYVAALAMACSHPNSELSERTRTRWYPMTDRVADVASLWEYGRQDGWTIQEIVASDDTTVFKHRLRRRRDVEKLEGYVLSHVFPAPEADISPESIEMFRRRHGDLLPSFRRFVQARVAEAMILEPLAALELLDDLSENCAEMQSEARAYLDEAGLGRVRDSTLLTLFKGLPVAGKIASLVQSLAGISMSPKRRSFLLNPLAYGVFAQAELGGRKPSGFEVHFGTDTQTLVPRL